MYSVLGVAEDADAEAIKKAYRALARTHHPDANPDDPAAEERFKEISHAHDVLSDPEKRREYDAERQFARVGGGFGGGSGSGGGAAGFGDL
ncbi:MAG: DnaJ domain-containing protein, partial [Miltoncostaeaceae bacterium]